MSTNNNLSIQITSDGSSTVFNEQLNQTYHSRHGAMQESKHVFVDAGLSMKMSQYLQNEKGKIAIFEMGFGTGLNAWLTASLASERKIKVYYEAIELFPLEEPIWNQLNYHGVSKESESLWHKLHEAEWNKVVSINDFFTLNKIQGELQKHQFNTYFDLVYFDAFSPEAQPELWTIETFQKLFDSMNEGAILTTYSSKGIVRRNMQAAGFLVEKLPGPAGKREMVRAIKK